MVDRFFFVWFSGFGFYFICIVYFKGKVKKLIIVKNEFILYFYFFLLFLLCICNLINIGIYFKDINFEIVMLLIKINNIINCDIFNNIKE